MPLDEHRRDDAGRPIDPERYQRLLEREHAEREREEFTVERVAPPAENPNLIMFECRDKNGILRGGMFFEYGAMEKELPSRLLERVKKAAAASPQPERHLKLVKAS